jgi:hypothetical protein
MRMHLIGYQPNIKYISSLIDKMDGTLYHILLNKDLIFNIKLKLLLKMFL